MQVEENRTIRLLEDLLRTIADNQYTVVPYNREQTQYEQGLYDGLQAAWDMIEEKIQEENRKHDEVRTEENNKESGG